MLSFFNLLKNNINDILNSKLLEKNLNDIKNKTLEDAINDIFTDEEKEFLKTQIVIFENISKEIKLSKDFVYILLELITKYPILTNNNLINKLSIIAINFNLTEEQLFFELKKIFSKN